MDTKTQSLLRECSRQLPFPIAQAVRGLEVAPPQPAVRAIKLFETAEAILQFVGTVVLVDAAEEAPLNRRIEQEIRSGLRFERGSIGAFGTSVQRLLPLISDPFLTDLGAVARGPGWGELLADLTELVHARNEQSHPIRFPTDSAAEKTWGRLLPTLVRVLVHLGSLAKCDLLVVDERKKLDATYYSLTVRLLTGWRDTPGWFRLKARCDFEPGDVVLVDRRRDRALLLTPFYLRQGDPARIGQSLLAYHRCERGVLEYYRCSFPDGDRVVVGAGDSRLRGDDPKNFLLRGGAAANRIPLRVDLGSVEDNEHRWTRSTEMEAVRDIPTSSLGRDRNKDSGPQSPENSAVSASQTTAREESAVPPRATPISRTSKRRAVVVFSAVGMLALGVSLYLLAREPSEEAPPRSVDVKSGPVREAVHAYQLVQQAYKTQDEQVYYGMYLDPVECWYSRKDTPVSWIREKKNGRGKALAVAYEKKETTHAAKVISESANEVVLSFQKVVPVAGVPVEHGKIVKLRKVGGVWRIAAEVEKNYHACFDPGVYGGPDDGTGWFSF